MDLESGQFYFSKRNESLSFYNILESDHAADVVIIGAGISGALMAHAMLSEGIPCTIVERERAGKGSTVASTSLIQYELDVPLHRLINVIGKSNAEEAYRLSGESVDRIASVAGSIGYTEFNFCESLYFAHNEEKMNYLQLEYECRKAAGFRVKLKSEPELLSEYGLHAPLAIVSDTAAKLNAYSLTHALLEFNCKRGLTVFENTGVESIRRTTSGTELYTSSGRKISANIIIHTTGYEALKYINAPKVQVSSTYAFASNPIPDLRRQFKDTVCWNTAEPYLYMREDNNRLIIGGGDEPFYHPRKRDVLLQEKVELLRNNFTKFYPGLRLNSEYAWTGTFASTHDGLPFIGSIPDFPGSYVALGYGGNGITFSALAATLIVEHIRNKANKIPDIFRLNRSQN